MSRFTSSIIHKKAEKVVSFSASCRSRKIFCFDFSKIFQRLFYNAILHFLIQNKLFSCKQLACTSFSDCFFLFVGSFIVQLLELASHLVSSSIQSQLLLFQKFSVRPFVRTNVNDWCWNGRNFNKLTIDFPIQGCDVT